MVFCCFEQTFEDEAVSTLVADDDAFVQTRKGKEHDNSDNRKKVSVIVPDGVYAGYALLVRSPDGKQVTQAVVPEGCGPGQSFSVTFPTYTPEVIDLNDHPPPGGCVQALDHLLTPNPSLPEVWGTHIVDDNDIVVEETRRALDTINVGNDSERDSPEGEPITNTLEPEEERTVPKQEPPAANSLVKMVSKAMGLSDDEDDDDDAFKTLTQSPSAATAPPRLSNAKQKKQGNNSKQNDQQEDSLPEQKLLVVRVPPGVQPGATIYVEIPGENRTVAATVPEGVSSFHVCYTPRQMPLLAPPTKRLQAPRPEERSMSNYRSAPHPDSRNVPTTTAAVPDTSNPVGQQKLLLVRVPQGTRAGTTIHVSVPDEPGRILAAVVPAGDVREFHVSYESRIIPIDAPPSRSFLPPASPYRNHSMGDSGLDDYGDSYGQY